MAVIIRQRKGEKDDGWRVFRGRCETQRSKDGWTDERSKDGRTDGTKRSTFLDRRTDLRREIKKIVCALLLLLVCFPSSLLLLLLACFGSSNSSSSIREREEREQDRKLRFLLVGEGGLPPKQRPLSLALFLAQKKTSNKNVQHKKYNYKSSCEKKWAAVINRGGPHGTNACMDWN